MIKEPIKLIACDMDGTLLNDKKRIPSGNIEAVRRLQEKDVRFVIATGRHDSMVTRYLDELGVDLPVISCNGALIREPRSGKLYSSVPLEREQVLEIIDICKDFDADYHIYAGDVIYGETMSNRMVYYHELNEDLQEKDRMNLLVSEDYKDFVDEQEGQLFKMLIIPGREEDFGPVKDEIFRRTGLEALLSDANLFDVTQKGTSKASAIRDLCRHLKLDRMQTAAIGDHMNDLDMIEHVEWGVAMNNAIPRIKDAARMVTENCNNRAGVAEALERLTSPAAAGSRRSEL